MADRDDRDAAALKLQRTRHGPGRDGDPGMTTGPATGTRLTAGQRLFRKVRYAFPGTRDGSMRRLSLRKPAIPGQFWHMSLGTTSPAPGSLCLSGSPRLSEHALASSFGGLPQRRGSASSSLTEAFVGAGCPCVPSVFPPQTTAMALLEHEPATTERTGMRAYARKPRGDLLLLALHVAHHIDAQERVGCGVATELVQG